MMLKEDLRTLAFDFQKNSRVVSVQHHKHGGENADVPVIETFFNDERFASPNAYPNAWIVTLDFSGSPELHQKVKDGEYRSVSWTAMVYEQEVLIPADLVADDPYDGKYDKTLSAQEPAAESDVAAAA
jgi:hypothetical protein